MAGWPLLYVGQSKYSQYLVLDIIEAFEEYLACGGSAMHREKILADLYRMLDHDPPGSSPPCAQRPSGIPEGLFQLNN